MDAAGHEVETLTALAFWMLVFFETTDDDTLDPDICVQQMEDIAWHLHQGGDLVRTAFRRYADQVAATDQRAEVRTIAAGAYDSIWG